MVLRVDPASRRISLSIKAALSKVIEETPEERDGEGETEVKPPRPRTTPLRGGLGKE